MSADRIAAAAATIAAARLARIRLAVLPEDSRPRDEAEAYRAQEAVHDRLVANGYGERIGYKIACTTRVMQDYLGIHSPCSAGLFVAGRHESGVRLLAADYRLIGVECEIAVRIGRDLPPGGAPFTAGTVRGAVATYLPAIEIVDDRYADWRTTDAPTLIADDFFSAGCVLGEPVSAAAGPDAADVLGTTVINGAAAGRGVGADVMGHPLNALAWLANHLAARGRTLKRGEIVLTGSLVETKWLAAGDVVRIDIAGLGSVGVTVA